MGCPKIYYHEILQDFAYKLATKTDKTIAQQYLKEESTEKLEQFIQNELKTTESYPEFFFLAGQAYGQVIKNTIENDGCDGLNACISGCIQFKQLIELCSKKTSFERNSVMNDTKKTKPYDKARCDWSYHASCTADVDCMTSCEMPCPYDRKLSPCEICSTPSCNKETCQALFIYNKRINKNEKKVTLVNFIERYRIDKALLEKHPEQKELLTKRIKEHEKHIIECVTSDAFLQKIKDKNLNF